MLYRAWMTDKDPRRVMQIAGESARRLAALAEAWTIPGGRIYTKNHVLEIMLQLVPGRLTPEEIAETPVWTRPQGRPKKHPLLRKRRKWSPDCLECRDGGWIEVNGEVERCCCNPEPNVEPTDDRC